MGGKLSTPNSPTSSRSGTITERAPPPSGLAGPTSSRSASLTVGSMNRAHRRPFLHFDPSLIVDNPETVEAVRLARANSTDAGLRIPRTNYRWLYANHLQDSDSSPEGDAGSSRPLPPVPAHSNVSRSLPHYFFSTVRDSKCPLCGKMIPAEDVEVHFVMCLTKPRVTYNEDVVSTESGECAICLEDLEEGEPIARLPCLCIYHKTCIDQWFLKSQTCPEHPPD
uniref:E3 ubiquitin-protein ligase ZNRF1 n=1 Tax=Phallusia mammillata TaxID=59560 RepID=A0A6F9DYV9_9ASCI|nr:E3 ubiquitin-protein ligase ZNRF2 [Phallusia mammillata]